MGLIQLLIEPTYQIGSTLDLIYTEILEALKYYMHSWETIYWITD